MITQEVLQAMLESREVQCRDARHHHPWRDLILCKSSSLSVDSLTELEWRIKPRPVTKTIIRYVNVLKSGVEWTYFTEDIAKQNALHPEEYQAIAVPVKGSYEVLE